MITFLTGPRGAGKTNWLYEQISEMLKLGAPVWGFFTPAVFDGEQKVAIDATLLPTGDTFRMAELKDAAKGQAFATAEEDGQPGDHWNFSSDAMLRINMHLAHFTPIMGRESVLVLDELGPLELQHHAGIVTATSLLDMQAVDNAIVVVRPELMDAALARWGAAPHEVIEPGQKPSFL